MKKKNNKRTNLEYAFRKLIDKLGFNYRFHLYSKTNTPLITWDFAWWKRIPGNPLNMNEKLFYEYYFMTADHNPTYMKRLQKVKNNHLPKSECKCITFSIPGPYSKDNAIFAILSNERFTLDIGIPCISSYDELNIQLDLIQ